MLKGTIYALLTLTGTFAAEALRLEDPRVTATVFAEHPEIWTPTGVAVDPAGRVFVIESNTHLPKENYPGPKTDRVRIFEDRDHDGKSDFNSLFAEGFRAAMNLAFAPSGALYLVERNSVRILRGTKSQTIVTLETKGDFPHNGLGGIAFGPDGWLYLGFGENLGLSYTLKGSDGSTVSGGGEGGNIFRCRLDGAKVELFATGFWNPFSLEFDGAGNLFTVDNDPDGRPPCRLLHVIRGGDYGYQFRYGRSGLHPFVAWDGELPGTLPMVAGTGEAPSGLIWLPRIGWPQTNAFLGTSWGDNLMETFPLDPRGASFKSQRKVFARGSQSFRPVAIAAGNDGAIYVTDWADREYAVHEKGRIWRIAPREKVQPLASSWKAKYETSPKIDALLKQASSYDPFIHSKAVTELATFHSQLLLPKRTSTNPRERLALLLAVRRKGEAPPLTALKRFLQDDDESIRRMAIIWATEQKMIEVRAALLPAALKEPASLSLVQTYLAAEQIFSGYEKKSVWEQGSTGAELVEALLKDESQPKELRELARKLKSSPQSRPIVGAPVAEPPQRPKTEGEWLSAIGFGGEEGQGRELFFSERIGCAKCHRVLGEGGKVGPDLSVIARSSDRAKLVNSLLVPSANIGPLYVTHQVTTKDGAEYSGLVPETKPGENLIVIQADGKQIEIPRDNIQTDRTLDTSLMPLGLEAAMTVREFADLISFMQSLR